MTTEHQTELNKTVSNLINKLSTTTKIVFVLLFAIIAYLVYLLNTKDNNSTIEYDTALIQQQIKNVSKLVVTEGHFAEVLNYKNSRETIIPGLSFDKKALVVVNADVTVSFDMSKVKYDVDAKNKTVTITNIPEAEIKISPDIKYYDTESSTFNEFTGEDYNKINKLARENLAKKIEKSTLKTNAKNRLVTEISNILITTKQLGWTLKYNGSEIKNNQQISSGL